MDVMQRLVDAGTVFAPYQWTYLAVNIGRVVDNIYVIPHGARSDVRASKDESKKELGLEGKKVIGMLGWFTESKGFHRVLEHWDVMSEKLGPDAVLVLAGEARNGDPAQQDYKKRLLSLIDESTHRDRIKLVLGSFAPEDYEKVLSSFDIMVMPYSFASQSGNLAHSFSLGIPVIATAMEGLKAAVDESGAGIGVPPGDDEELERAVVSIMKDDALRERFSQKAKDYVQEKISWPIIVTKHIRLYNKLISKKRRAEIDVTSDVMLEE
jgi:glycosyltransferase involved in cell wall biosynthesis